MKLGRYEVLDEIGQGGTAVVYRARSPGGETVAIKLLRGEADEAARFAREQEVHAALGTEEGFVPLLDSGTSPAGPFIVMPLLEGGTLRARLEESAYEPLDAASLGRALAASLGRVHAKGIVHRDMKPENVLFATDGRPLIADLGLAKHWKHEVTGTRFKTLTLAGVVYGSVGYMSPEQLGDRNATTVGPPGDVFALGAILYECVAGRPAFSGVNPFAIVKTLVAGGPEPVEAIRPDVPAWLAAAIRKALRRAPSDRFADGARFAEALSP